MQLQPCARYSQSRCVGLSDLLAIAWVPSCPLDRMSRIRYLDSQVIGAIEPRPRPLCTHHPPPTPTQSNHSCASTNGCKSRPPTISPPWTHVSEHLRPTNIASTRWRTRLKPALGLCHSSRRGRVAESASGSALPAPIPSTDKPGGTPRNREESIALREEEYQTSSRRVL